MYAHIILLKKLQAYQDGLHLYLTHQDVLLGKHPKKWVFYEYLSEISKICLKN
jgi:hypothetical protein